MMRKLESVRRRLECGGRIVAAGAAAPSMRRIPCMRALPAAVAPALVHLRSRSRKDLERA